MSLKQIAQNLKLVENLFGTAAKTGAALIDSQDWFENDQLLDKIPYGKIVTWLIKKATTIDNIDEAFNHAYAMAYFLCFSQSVKRYKVFLKGTDLVEIKENRKAELLFPLNNAELIEADIFIDYTNTYQELLDSCKINEKTKNTIINYIRWNLKIVFHELLEEKPVTYKKLCDELDKKSFSLRKEKLQIIKYYQQQKNLFLSPVMGDEQGMTLKEVYIEPNYRIHKNSIEKDKVYKYFNPSEFTDSERNSVNMFVEPKYKAYDRIHGLLNEFVSDNLIKDKIKHPETNTLVLLGYPGQGKTSCIRKMLFDLIEDIENPALVYHLPLRSIENVTDFCNAPFEIIEEHIKDKNLPDDYAKKLVNKGTIILEGLDELAIQSGANEKTIDDVVKELLRVQENREEVKLIITSRLGYIDTEQFVKKNLVVLQLKEFNIEHQIKWLKKYKEFYPHCKIKIQDIEKFNKGDHHLKELINQPILLHMVVTSDITITESSNRAQLYKTLFDSLIKRKWADEKKSHKQIEILKKLEPEDLREIIQDIALAIFHGGRNCIQKSEIEKLEAVKRHIIQNLGFNNLGGALKGVMVSFYFQEIEQKEENGNSDFGIEFLHKSLSEYMAAEKIWKEIKTFLETFSTGKRYLVDSFKDALETLNSSFAPQLLTSEVRDYICQIMDNDTAFDRKELSGRFVCFLPELLQNEFLWSFDAEKTNYPIKQALHTFYGYWTILSRLSMHSHENYLTEENLPEFVNLLRSCLLLSPPSLFLTYQTLKNTKLEGAILVGARLEGANLEGANLERANLSKAILEGANLEHALLTAANLEGANLERANLEEAKLKGANLDGANLDGANLKGANLEGVNLKGANLDGANLERMYLYGKNLEGANLERANLKGANLEGANLRGANLKGAFLEGAKLKGASMKNANLERASMKNANLNEVSLDGANLRGANFEGAKLIEAYLDGVELVGANLKGVDLMRSILVGANLDGANLEGADLERANLVGASLIGSSLIGSSLKGANLIGADLDGVNLDGVNLKGTNIEPENLDCLV